MKELLIPSQKTTGSYGRQEGVMGNEKKGHSKWNKKCRLMKMVQRRSKKESALDHGPGFHISVAPFKLRGHIRMTWYLMFSQIEQGRCMCVGGGRGRDRDSERTTQRLNPGA